MSNWFNYDDMVTRNIGFVSPEEQDQLKTSKVFVAGVGGMGGAALLSLVRAGVESFVIADFDSFEVSNFNRQVFADYDSLDIGKVESTVTKIKKINPNLKLELFGKEWDQNLDNILPTVDVVINGCDDTLATIKLMRMAKKHNKTVIDAYASIFPSVYVVQPESPRPEDFLNYPTKNKSIEKINQEDLKGAFTQELLFVLTNTSSMKFAHLPTASQMITGERKRISFSHMVMTTGCMMSYEAVKVLLNRKKYLAHYKGLFFNPWDYKIEKPLFSLFFCIKRFFVKLYLKKLGL